MKRNITMNTLNKVKKFLKKQKEPITKTRIVALIGVDYYSLNTALEMLNAKKDKNGRIYL